MVQCRVGCCSYANKRRPKTELMQIYAGRVDFSLIQSDKDALFNPDVAEAWPQGYT